MKIRKVVIHNYVTHEAFKLFNDKLDAIHCLLLDIKKEELKMDATLDQVLAETTRQTTIQSSVETLVKGLRDQIAALPGIPAAAQEEINRIFASLQANNAAAEALVANVQPAPVPDPGTGAD